MIKRIAKELLHHLPYSAVGVAAALGILLGFEKMGWGGKALLQFHSMHGLHIFLGSLVASALYWEYEKKIFKVLLVGFVIPIFTCTLSDIVVPYFGGVLFGKAATLHVDAIEEPFVVYGAGLAGFILGILFLRWVKKGTEFAHLAHVLISSLASLLYLVSFTPILWRYSTFLAFIITLIAVWLPCCLSDIVFPLLFTKGGKSPCCGHHPHDY